MLSREEKAYLEMLAPEVSGGSNVVRGWGVHASGTIYEDVCKSLAEKGVIEAYACSTVSFVEAPEDDIVAWAEGLVS